MKCNAARASYSSCSNEVGLRIRDSGTFGFGLLWSPHDHFGHTTLGIQFAAGTGAMIR